MPAHSFIVRVLGEWEVVASGWYGVVVDTATGERAVWRRRSEAARLIARCLAQPAERTEVTGMAPTRLTDVVSDMLAVLGARLPVPLPGLPEPNVTLERVRERLVGLGNQRGTEPLSSLGRRTLRGGRLDARVRFQLWGVTAPGVDAAVLALQSDLLDDRDELRQAGFLRLAAAETTLAERVDTVQGWRKATSFDVLYEYRYVDDDDADSLIAQIPVTLDLERGGGPDRDAQTLTDEMVRWDDERAPALRVGGPVTVRRLSACVFVPGPAPWGSVVVARTDGSAAAVTHLPDLAAFLAATGGPAPTETNADVTLAPSAFFAALGPTGDALDLGDWDGDGSTDRYDGFDRRLDIPIELPGPSDVLTVTYTAPGPSSGLDRTAVVYLRVNAPE